MQIFAKNAITAEAVRLGALLTGCAAGAGRSHARMAYSRVGNALPTMVALPVSALCGAQGLGFTVYGLWFKVYA